MAFGVVGFETEANRDLGAELRAQRLDLRDVLVELVFAHREFRIAFPFRKEVQRNVVREGHLDKTTLDRRTDELPRVAPGVAASERVDVIIGETGHEGIIPFAADAGGGVQSRGVGWAEQALGTSKAARGESGTVRAAARAAPTNQEP